MTLALSSWTALLQLCRLEPSFWPRRDTPDPAFSESQIAANSTKRASAHVANCRMLCCVGPGGSDSPCAQDPPVPTAGPMESRGDGSLRHRAVFDAASHLLQSSPGLLPNGRGGGGKRRYATTSKGPSARSTDWCIRRWLWQESGHAALRYDALSCGTLSCSTLGCDALCCNVLSCAVLRCAVCACVCSQSCCAVAK